MKTCPRCAELVQDAAQVCRFCGFRFSQTKTTQQTLMSMLGVILGIALLMFMLRGCETQVPALAPTEAAKSPQVVKQCAELLRKSERAGLIKERPASNRINVDDAQWARFPASSKRGVILALGCDAFNGEPLVGVEGHAVVYGYRSGKRLAMLTSVGINYD